MKVLYMSHRYHTNQTAIVKGWIENGHEVRFLSQYAGKVEDYTYIRPVVVGYSPLFRVFDYLYVHCLKRKDPAAIDMKLKCGIPPLLKIAKYIKEFKPDVAILRERSMYTICMCIICKHYHIPTILYNQSPVWDGPERMDLAHKIVWKLTPEYRITPVKLTEKALQGLIGKEITEAGIVGEDIARDSIVREDIVKNDKVYWVPFVMEPQEPPEEKTYFAENRINIFCIGKYQERKNHQMMIEAVEELLPRYNLQLTIAGEISNSFHEEYYRKVSGYVKEHGLEDRVTFLSNLKKEDVAKEYRKADVYVLPSTGEPAAVTPLEAMAYSVPAICSTGNGTADYIDPGRTGYIFRDNDKKDLKDKLEKIICDRDNLVRMGAAAYHHVKENFQFSNYYEQIEQILHEMKRHRESREKMIEK